MREDKRKEEKRQKRRNFALCSIIVYSYSANTIQLVFKLHLCVESLFMSYL